MKWHVQDQSKLFTSLQSVREKNKKKYTNTYCFLVRSSTVISKSVSLPGSSQLLPRSYYSSGPGSVHPGAGWGFSNSRRHWVPRSPNSLLLKAALDHCLRAPGHLHPASKSIMFQNLSLLISLLSFILDSLHLKHNGYFLRSLALTKAVENFQLALCCSCWCILPAAGKTLAEVVQCSKPVSREYWVACGVNMVHWKDMSERATKIYRMILKPKCACQTCIVTMCSINANWLALEASCGCSWLCKLELWQVTKYTVGIFR